MPLYVIYLLIAVAFVGAGGAGFLAGQGLQTVFSFVGIGAVLFILWQPLIKPLLEKFSKK